MTEVWPQLRTICGVNSADFLLPTSPVRIWQLHVDAILLRADDRGQLAHPSVGHRIARAVHDDDATGVFAQSIPESSRPRIAVRILQESDTGFYVAFWQGASGTKRAVEGGTRTDELLVLRTI